MLSDRDRETLLDIQHGLDADDPDWVRAFDTEQQRLPIGPPLDWVEIGCVVGTVLAVLLCVLMVIVGTAGPALFFAMTGGLLICLQWRRRSGPGRAPASPEK